MIKREILAKLKKANGFLSGEELSRQLGMSRSAVWKHINALRREGYQITAHTRRGYRLCAAPSLLLPAEVQPRLTTRCFGQTYHFFTSLPSTNLTAKELARQGAPEGAVVVTEEQTAGRGRLGRLWSSPPDTGLYLSLILRPQVPLAVVPQVTLLTAVSVCRALEIVTPARPRIKWPNDILLAGKKVCGILTELNAEMEQVNYLVAGVGINLNQAAEGFPAAVASVATSVAAATGFKVDRVELLTTLLAVWEADYNQWVNTGFAAVREAWSVRAAGLGTFVRVIAGSREWVGRAEDLDDTGALLVRDLDGQLHRLISGEVSLRPERGSNYDFGS
ncbi:MAG: biotin--[acetyl-CoA-carboxylase] ligase [Heliobacteriaceae bacterium]|nr:biotin--[acetyl-CoA-carboxylase] ligase [Heliobacteriaceae bacterium]